MYKRLAIFYLLVGAGEIFQWMLWNFFTCFFIIWWGYNSPTIRTMQQFQLQTNETTLKSSTSSCRIFTRLPAGSNSKETMPMLINLQPDMRKFDGKKLLDFVEQIFRWLPRRLQMVMSILESTEFFAGEVVMASGFKFIQVPGDQALRKAAQTWQSFGTQWAF